MPAAVTDFGAPAWLSALFAVTTRPTSYWLALLSDPPGEATDGTIIADLEPAGGGYARQSYGTGGGNWDVNGNYLVNLNAIDFGIATTDWGSVDHFGLCTASSGGDVYAYGELADAVFVETDYHLIVPAGGIAIALVTLAESIAI